MEKISRRDFTMMCVGALAAFNELAGWPQTSAASSSTINPDDDELASLSLLDASTRIRNRSVTSVQLTRALLNRVAIYDRNLNSYITVMAADAIKQAEQLDKEAQAGFFRSPLHGIPLALKDNIDTAGTRTTAASPMFKTRVPTEDAEVVKRFKNSGVVILGKLNLHEFALGCTGDVSYFGPSRNPWDLELVTGGSSGGSGAAVAADLCYGALGTDTGGSIRVPSSWCGIVGIKPTVGLVSLRGIIPCLASLDHCGPMARTVEDAALMLTQLAGYDSLDAFSVEHAPQDYFKLMKQPVSSFKLGAPVEFYDHLDAEVAEIVATATEVLTHLTRGVTSHAPLPAIPEGENFFNALGDTAAYHEPLIKQSGMDYMPPTINDIKAIMAPASAADSARAHHTLVMIRRQIDAAFKEVDLVVMPTTTSFPKPIKAALKEEMSDRKPTKAYDFFDPMSGCSNTAPFDVYGIPALTLPCGFSQSGLPVGLTIAGPHFSEGKVLALAYAFQQATDWHKRKPNLTPGMHIPPLIEDEVPEPKKS